MQIDSEKLISQKKDKLFQIAEFLSRSFGRKFEIFDVAVAVRYPLDRILVSDGKRTYLILGYEMADNYYFRAIIRRRKNCELKYFIHGEVETGGKNIQFPNSPLLYGEWIAIMPYTLKTEFIGSGYEFCKLS